MDLIKYEAFYRAATLGNVTRAAEEMGYSQSGVSHMIRDLEKEAGLVLLDRGKSGVSLTEEGRAILPAVGRMLEEKRHLDEEIAALRGLETGTVRVGAFTSVSVHWLPRIIKAMESRTPGIRVEPVQGDYNEIARWMDQGRIDCGFLTDSSCPDRFDLLPLSEDRMMAVLAPDHPLCREKAVPIEEAARQDFIFPGPGFDGDTAPLLERAGVKPRVRYTVYGDESLVALAGAGLGMAILPELYLLSYRDKVCALPLKPPVKRRIGLILRKGVKPSPAVSAFIRTSRAVLAEMKA